MESQGSEGSRKADRSTVDIWILMESQGSEGFNIWK